MTSSMVWDHRHQFCNIKIEVQTIFYIVHNGKDLSLYSKLCSISYGFLPKIENCYT